MKKAFFPKAEHKGSWREEPPVANKSHYVFAFKRGGAFHVMRDFFKPSEHMQHYGPIDLFLSSHVLEHVPDLCGWGAALFTTMKAGGAIFSEVPNHNRASALHTPHNVHSGGVFHVSLPTPRSMTMLMESAGFRAGVVQTVSACPRSHSCGIAAGLDGLQVRSLFFKPGTNERTSQMELGDYEVGMPQWIRSWDVPKSWRKDVQGYEWAPASKGP